jgi:NAD+ synthase (glutamine-hydrolysing)
MKVVLAQIEVFPGQIQKNLDNMWTAIQKANDEGNDIIAFPELCVGGYMVGDLYYDPDFVAELDAANRWLYEKINKADFRKFKIGVIYGNISPSISVTGQDGRPGIYNCAFFVWKRMRDRTSVVSVPKRLLPNYRFFDDKRYFLAGSEETSEVFDFHLRSGGTAKIGLEVCEDVWHDDYPENPTADLARKGAEYVFNISASPYSYGKGTSRNRQIERTLQYIVNSPIKYFFYVNNVGAQNNGKNIITFDGNSSVYRGNGQLVDDVSNAFHPELFKFDTAQYDGNSRTEGSLYPSFSKELFQFEASLAGIRSMDQIMGSDKFPYIIGVSGGIDSAVVLCLLEQAVGKDRIQAYNLPSEYNSAEIKGAAHQLCAALNIPLQTIPISCYVDPTLTLLTQLNGIQEVPSLVEENVQAKVRGTTLLSNIAGLMGGVMTNNGNKVEVALGYATLYGDVNGAIAPLGDLLKTEVWALAEWMNENLYGREVIPKELFPNSQFEIPLPPSAELKEKQIDPMKWGYHDALLAYLLNYKRGGVKALIAAHKNNWKEFEVLLAKALPDPKVIGALSAVMKRYNLEDKAEFLADLDWFLKAMNRATFKRIQSPPIIVQSKSAFGFDHRESQVPWTRDVKKMWDEA